MSDIRREFIILLGSAALAWPFAARAQQSVMPVIGFLNPSSADGWESRLRAFRQGLKDEGFVEGENVVIEYRSAEDQGHRLPALVADSLRQQVALMSEIPLRRSRPRLLTGGDPVNGGLVASLNRPGSNLTGVSFLSGASGMKRLELLRQLVPKAAAIAMLVDPNPKVPQAKRELRDVQAAAHAIGQELIVVEAGSDRVIFGLLTNDIVRWLPSEGGLFPPRNHVIGFLAALALVSALVEIDENQRRYGQRKAHCLATCRADGCTTMGGGWIGFLGVRHSVRAQAKSHPH
jgi:hypothetical protein